MSSSAVSARRRLGAHERQHRVDAVEQEVGPDPRLQRLQPRLGDRRRQRLGAQPEIAEQHRRAEQQREHQPCRSRASGRLRREPLDQEVDGDARGDDDAATTPAHGAPGRRASQGCAAYRIASASRSCGSTLAARSTHSAASRSQRGSRSHAATSTTAFAPRSTRRIVPMLRKSGSGGGAGFCLIIGRIATPHATSVPTAGGGPCGRSPRRRTEALRQVLLSATRTGAASDHCRVPLPEGEIPTPDPAPDRPCHHPGTPPPMANFTCNRRARRLVRTLCRARLRAGEALHGVRRLRPPPRRRRHRRLARARADARRSRRAAPRRPRRDRARAGDDPRRDRARRVRLVARSRGRAPQHREAAHRADRRRRQAAAHRALAQRPGRHRHAPVAARRRSTACRPCSPRLRRALHRPGRAARRHDHARLHPPAGRATGHLRPPPARLRGDARAATPSASPTAAGASTGCRWAPPRSPGRATRSTATGSRASSASTASAATRSTPSPIATSRSSSRPRRRC